MIGVDRKLNLTDVLDALTDLFILRGPPDYIRSDTAPEFIAQKVRNWIVAVGAKTGYNEQSSLWENGYCESFNARFRDEFLNSEIFYSLRAAQILIAECGETLQHATTTQCLELSPAGPRSHHPDGPKAEHALPIKLDHSNGPDQRQNHYT